MCYKCGERCSNCRYSLTATIRVYLRGDELNAFEPREAMLCDRRGGIEVQGEMWCPKWEERKKFDQKEESDEALS